VGGANERKGDRERVCEREIAKGGGGRQKKKV
jgi:hypothetical protein